MSSDKPIFIGAAVCAVAAFCQTRARRDRSRSLLEAVSIHDRELASLRTRSLGTAGEEEQSESFVRASDRRMKSNCRTQIPLATPSVVRASQ